MNADQLAAVSTELERVLKLRAIPFGMKLFETVEEMAAIPKIRRPQSTLHTTDQIVAQAARLGWTVGITAEDLSRALEGMAALAKNGLRYPFPQYGIQQDVRAGMAASYPERK